MQCRPIILVHVFVCVVVKRTVEKAGQERVVHRSTLADLSNQIPLLPIGQ